MTIEELKFLEELVCFARGKAFTDHSMKLVNYCAEVIAREIKDLEDQKWSIKKST